ncbi:Vms1/Ankzf1 family peptidyl-tRNA hydrolase [Streptomyces sp. NPDC126499]|uniref:baeRF2 domain-containing protein n=1 Tax=Streptomyces sp. NPDC126499 TaxID=3155314 RepID=UPI0033267A31
MKLDFLEPVAHKGPWASVYATSGPPDEASADRRELTWRELCRSLEEQGADAATTQAVREALDRTPPDAGAGGLALFAADGRVALTRRLDRPPGRPEAHWGELPRVTPLLETAGQAPGCVVALVDRSGADYHVYGPGATEDEGSVEGRDWPLRRAAAGDWSATHFDAAVENTWEENAALIAGELTRVFHDSDAAVMVLAGGGRECHAVHDHLPDELRGVTRISSHGGRAAGADTELLMADVEAARMEVAAQSTEAVLDRFRAGRGDGDRPTTAVEGVPAVTEAARQHRLDTLLISPAGPDANREIWVGDEPDQVAVRRSEAESLGAQHPHAERADDALVLCAAVAGGEAVVVPGDGSADAVPAGGIGALLRWPRSEQEESADR